MVKPEQCIVVPTRPYVNTTSWTMSRTVSPPSSMPSSRRLGVSRSLTASYGPSSAGMRSEDWTKVCCCQDVGIYFLFAICAFASRQAHGRADGIETLDGAGTTKQHRKPCREKFVAAIPKGNQVLRAWLKCTLLWADKSASLSFLSQSWMLERA